jgi:hypothetical protein
MKPPPFRIPWACICSIILLAGSSLADRPAKPPAAKDLVGAYVGYSDHDDFYRLDLRSDHTGYLAEVSPPSSILHQYGVSTYRLTQWTLKRFDLVISLTPVDSKSEGIFLKGRADASLLRLEVGGTNGEWKRKVVLYSEQEMRVSNAETRAAIRRAEGK